MRLTRSDRQGVVMWMEDFSLVFDYTGSAGIFRIGGLCSLYSNTPSCYTTRLGGIRITIELHRWSMNGDTLTSLEVTRILRPYHIKGLETVWS